MLRTSLAVVLVALNLGAPATSPGAAAASCSIAAAAGRPPAPPLAQPAGKGFRIFWHVATQVEQLADAGGRPQVMQDIQLVQNLSGGYYINVLPAGPNAYWPGRPTQCRLNFRNLEPGSTIEVEGEQIGIGAAPSSDRKHCVELRGEFLAKIGYPPGQTHELHVDVMKRIARNLDLTGEAARGKDITAEVNLEARTFSYDDKADSIAMKAVPDNLCFLYTIGVTPNGITMFQADPRMQMKSGIYLWIPRKTADGRLQRSADFAADKTPGNPHAFDVVQMAFARDRIPFGSIYALFRNWSARKSPGIARQLAAMPEIGGFNFEGGPRDMALAPKTLKAYGRGIAWLLQNTGKNVMLLMPGYWDNAGVGSETEIDTLPARTVAYVKAINGEANRFMALPAGNNALCTGRVILVPASYGRPISIATLPSMRGGHFAGTVTGQIRALAQFRKELCGV